MDGMVCHEGSRQMKKFYRVGDRVELICGEFKGCTGTVTRKDTWKSRGEWVYGVDLDVPEDENINIGGPFGWVTANHINVAAIPSEMKLLRS
jgi:hypothetical protein